MTANSLPAGRLDFTFWSDASLDVAIVSHNVYLMKQSNAIIKNYEHNTSLEDWYIENQDLIE